MKKYTTIQGDTWDQIAYNEYGDEGRIDQLMKANPTLLDYFVFPSNIEVNIPNDETEEEYDGMPDWRYDND